MSKLRSFSLGFGVLLCAGAAYLPYLATADSAANPVIMGEGSSFERAPPMIENMQITANPASPDNNALLEFKYAGDRRLSSEIAYNIGGEPVQLLQDPENPQLYRAKISFDFDAFIKEQADRQKLATSKATVPRFAGREHLDNKLIAFLDPSRLRELIASGVPIQVPGDVVLAPASIVRPEASLMITHPRVVEDPRRTFDACTGTGDPNGAWTFNQLMTNMANQSATGMDPSDFVEKWLRTWANSTTINSMAVPARTQMITQVLDNWPRLSTGKLDLTRSPMRLLAIVNRVDLRSNAAYGGGTAGEGRFVFGIIQPDASFRGGCKVLPATVILEYGVPISGCEEVRSYAQQWGDLDALSLGSSAYNSALQAITDQFTAANASPRKPNGSAINQIRTNEFLNRPWELREFNILLGDNHLSIVPAKQTPHDSFNDPATGTLLADYINANEPLILLEEHSVPLSFMGAPFLAGSVPNILTVWAHPGISNNDARNKFSLNTCDACHGGETETKFLHVEPRASGAEAVLSRFLIGNGSLASPTTFTMSDPVDLVTPRTYGDLLRRQTDLATLQSNACRAGAVFQQAGFIPLTATH
jgi:hypothetical protein